MITDTFAKYRVWKDDKVIMYLFFSWNYIYFNFKHLSVQKLFRGVSFFTNYGVRFIARLRHLRRVWRRARAIARLICRTLYYYF